MEVLQRFGYFGFDLFFSYHKFVLGTAILVSGFCTLCFLSASSAWSQDYNSLQNIAFALLDKGAVIRYFGLHGVSYQINGVITIIEYGSPACALSYCNDCKSTTNSTFGLIMISLFLSIVSTILLICRIVQDRVEHKAAILITSTLSIFLAIAGFGNWYTTCFHSLTKYDDMIKLHYGFTMSIIASVSVVHPLLINIFTPTGIRNNKISLDAESGTF